MNDCEFRFSNYTHSAHSILNDHRHRNPRRSCSILHKSTFRNYITNSFRLNVQACSGLQRY